MIQTLDHYFHAADYFFALFLFYYSLCKLQQFIEGTHSYLSHGSFDHQIYTFNNIDE